MFWVKKIIIFVCGYPSNQSLNPHNMSRCYKVQTQGDGWNPYINFQMEQCGLIFEVGLIECLVSPWEINKPKSLIKNPRILTIIILLTQPINIVHVLKRNVRPKTYN